MIGILTFYWADDYGALLQGYALKTYLNRFEKTVMVPYIPRALASRYRLLRSNKAASRPRRVYETARQTMSRTFLINWKAKQEMSRFRRRYLTKSRRAFGSSKEIGKWGERVDVYVVGSDQVWNPDITEGFQEGYFCTFRQWKKEKARYVSYAASIGTEGVKDEYEETLCELLSGFDAISVRESPAAASIGRLCHKEPDVVLDPVFLLGRNEWEALYRRRTKRKRKHKGYIAVYYTEYNPAMAECLKRLEAETGLASLILRPRGRIRSLTDRAKCMVCGDPCRFMELLCDAEYVVTNSFHGTALSILFQKQFVTFAHSERNARIQDLLRRTNLEGRLAQTAKAAERIAERIDWERVEAALEKEIRHAKEFIAREILAPSPGNKRPGQATGKDGEDANERERSDH